MNTPQQNAVALATQLQAVCNQLDSLKANIDRLVSIYNSEGINAIWAAMQTAPVNADGSVSNTPDGTPNAVHPIIASNLNISSTKLVAAIVMFQQLQNFFNNAAVTQGNYTQNVRDVASV